MPRAPRIHSADEIVASYRRYRCVATFLGFGELGYEDPTTFEELVERELASFDRQDVVINAATLITVGLARGVADVYEIARHAGFRTAGLYPSVSLLGAESHCLSAFVDDVYFIQDETWGGYLEGSTVASATLRALTSITDQVVAIGGGKHTAQELDEFLARGVPVRYHALEMNRAIATRWHGERGEDLKDFLGSAYWSWAQASTRAS